MGEERSALDEAAAIMERWAAEAEAKKKKEADAKEAVNRAAGEGDLERGARQGRSGLGSHTKKLLDQIDN